MIQPMKEKDMTYTAYFLGRYESELVFTMRIADTLLESIGSWAISWRNLIDMEISKIRIIDSIMDLKYSDFAEYYKAHLTLSYHHSFGEDKLRKIYDYAIQYPNEQCNPEMYHDIIVDFYKEKYKKTEE